MHEVQQLGGGAGHAAVLTGKSAIYTLIWAFSLCSGLLQLHTECSKIAPLIKRCATQRLSTAQCHPAVGPPSCIRKPERKASPAANIGQGVKGGRPARLTPDPPGQLPRPGRADEEG